MAFLDSLTRKQKGTCTIIGGFLVHFVNGILYLWGNINVYVRSYFCYEGEKSGDFCEGCGLTTATVNVVFPFILTALIIAMPFGAKISDKFGARNWNMIAAVICGGSVFLSSFFSNFWGFAILYGIIFGFAGGFSYLIPFYLAHKYFPANKGLVSGIIASGFGMGSFIFSLIQYQLVNPDNEHFEDGCTSREIADNLPSSLRIMGILYFVLFFIGALLTFTPNEKDLAEAKIINDNFLAGIKEKKRLQAEKDRAAGKKEKAHVEHGECHDFKTALKQPILWIGIFHLICLSGTGIILSSNYKPYGSRFFDDGFLTWVGNAGNITNSISRFFWAYMLDFFHYKILLIIMPAIQIFVLLMITHTTSSSFAYFLMLVLSYFAYGGFYSIYPTVFSGAYGKKYATIASGIVFFGFALASWVQFFIVRSVVDGDTDDVVIDQYEDTFHTYLISPCIAFVMSIVLSYDINWNKIYGTENKSQVQNKQQQQAIKVAAEAQEDLPEKQYKQQPDNMFGAKAPTDSQAESNQS